MPVARRRTARAHPRACGENVDAAPVRVCAMGSSPRVRGKHLGQRLDARR